MGVYKPGSNEIMYSSKDGNIYNTPWEAKAADTKYEQQEELIKQMKKANGQTYSYSSESDICTDEELKQLLIFGLFMLLFLLILLSPFIAEYIRMKY